MSVRRMAPDHIQPKEFSFDAANQNWVQSQVAKYPGGRQASAVIPLLWQAQKQAGGWLPKAAIEHVARVLGMPNIRVFEVATFYTMFNLAPVGQHFVQLCGTTPCALRGANDIKKVCEARIGPEKTVTSDGKFSWLEVECLGACCNAPMVQINDDYYEDLTPENFAKLLDDLAAGGAVKTGSQTGRNGSEPEGDVKTLRDAALYDGSAISIWRKTFDERLAAAAAAKAAAQAPATPPASSPPVAPAAPVAPPVPAPSAKAQAEANAAAPARPAPTQSPTNVAKDTPAPEGNRSHAAERAADPNAGAAASGLTFPLVGESLPRTGSGVAAKRREGGDQSPSSQPSTPPSPTFPHKGGEGSIERAAMVSGAPQGPMTSGADKPALLTAARGGAPDDLSLIWGVGPKLEKMLNEMGIWHFDQIAAWSGENLRWVDANLRGFKGRAMRDKWVDQAKKLASGWRPESAVGDKPKG